MRYLMIDSSMHFFFKFKIGASLLVEDYSTKDKLQYELTAVIGRQPCSVAMVPELHATSSTDASKSRCEK